MISPLSSTTQSEPVDLATGTSIPKPTGAEPKTATVADSVQISKAAQVALATLQELRETPTQTANEASHGDLQAQRLLASEAAAKSR